MEQTREVLTNLSAAALGTSLVFLGCGQLSGEDGNDLDNSPRIRTGFYLYVAGGATLALASAVTLGHMATEAMKKSN